MFSTFLLSVLSYTLIVYGCPVQFFLFEPWFLYHPDIFPENSIMILTFFWFLRYSSYSRRFPTVLVSRIR